MNSDWRKDYIRYRSLFANFVANYKSRADAKAYLEVLLSLVTITVFTLFALRPTVITIAQLLKDIEAKRAVIARMDAKIENLARARSVYESERSRIAILESAIPKSSQPDVFARQIEGLVGTHKVSVTSFSQVKGVITGTPAPSTSKNALPEEASGSGFSLAFSTNIDSYQSLSDLLSDFEKLRTPAVFQEVRISKGREKDEQNVVLYLQGELPYLLFGLKQ